eukprot:4991558-Lingulodinium_polyedra.AAC.1
MKAALRQGVPLAEFVELLYEWMASAPGPVGRQLGAARRRLRPRPRHLSDEKIFPLPQFAAA